MPYASVNGHMYTWQQPNGDVALRLPPGVREEFLARFDTKLFNAYGMVQKEYVTITPTVLAETDTLAPYLIQSLAYTKSLKPKKPKA